MKNTKTEKIVELLLKRYPDPEIALNFSNPLELLIATILSAQCTDARVNEVTKSLFRKYETAKDYTKADLRTLEEEIRPTGFYKNKAKMIISCCEKLIKDFNSKIPSTLEELMTLPGVGRKTANVILGNAFGKQAIAVDTHVLRVSKRLGIARSDNPDRVEEELNRQIPEGRWTAFNLALILHGRETCTARKPKCSECVSYDECEWPERGSRVISLKSHIFPDLSIEDIKRQIKGDTGEKIFFYEVVSSTNTIAAELAEKGSMEGAVVLADSQTKGRGRYGRLWVSPPGVNIYMSIILRPKIKPKDATLITVVAATGSAAALRRVTGLNVTIKWPNDLIVSDKKIGGILTELKTDPDRIIFAIMGIGINVNIDIGAFPDSIRDVATSIKNETGIPYSRAVIIAEILNEIDHRYKILNGMKKRMLLSEWQQLTSTLGREVKVTIGKETLTGLAESVDDEGMLILRLPSGRLKRISSGDLTVLR